MGPRVRVYVLGLGVGLRLGLELGLRLWLGLVLVLWLGLNRVRIRVKNWHNGNWAALRCVYPFDFDSALLPSTL